MLIVIYQGYYYLFVLVDINIVIDVIRVFMVVYYVFIGGVKEILLVWIVDEVFVLKDIYLDYVLMGEEKGVGISGFDLDNFLKCMVGQNMMDKSLIQKIINGVIVVLGVLNVKYLFVIGFFNVKIMVQYVKKFVVNDCVINIVVFYLFGDDDMVCVEYIKGIIEGINVVMVVEVIERIKGFFVVEKFFDCCQLLFDLEDIVYCIKELMGDFVMKVK